MFFDFPEIGIIFGVALVVLGPKKLPGAAAQIGRWVGRARGMARQFREQLEQEVNSVESALDTNPTRQPTIKPPASPAPVTPEAPPPPGALEAPADDPAAFVAPGVGWHPGEAGSEGFLSPEGDPDAIPPADEDESSDAQLSLQLDVPAAAAPRSAAPAKGPDQTEATAAEQREGR